VAGLWGKAGLRSLARSALTEADPEALVSELISIPPKYAVSQVVDFIKGKSAINFARCTERSRNFRRSAFWTRRDFVSTVGRDEEREYIREMEDRRLDQLNLCVNRRPLGHPRPGAVASATQDSRFERLKILKPPALPGDSY
jgi:Transposase IS200 like